MKFIKINKSTSVRISKIDSVEKKSNTKSCVYINGIEYECNISSDNLLKLLEQDMFDGKQHYAG